MSNDSASVILEGLVSIELLRIFEIILHVTLTATISLLGTAANIINIIIFYKQGLNNTMNISLFGLAVSDLVSVATLEWTTLCFNPLFVNSGIPWDFKHVMYFSGGWPHLCFGRITCWITAYITAERCLCIALPLKVKQIITPRRTTFIICFLYVINILATVPIYCSAYLGWIFSPEQNRTILSFTPTEYIAIVEPIGYVLYAVMGTASFPAVIFFTCILVFRLRRQSTWRAKSSTDNRQTEMTSKRDIKTMNMVVFIAGILICCYTPGVVVSLTASFEPSFSLSGTNANLYYVMWAFVALLEATNSSINIFIYYHMSSKYKQKFQGLFCCCVKFHPKDDSVVK